MKPEMGGKFISMTDSLQNMIHARCFTQDELMLIIENIESVKLSYKETQNKYPDDENAVIWAFMNKLQESIEHFIKNNPNGQKITCAKGCAFCCHVNVDITKPEADLLARYTIEHAIPVNSDRLAKQSKVSLDEDGFIPLSYEDSACIFLDEHSQCMVYEYRPMACRKYMVITPPDECNIVTNRHGKVGRAVDINGEMIVSALYGILETNSMAKMFKQSIHENEKKNKILIKISGNKSKLPVEEQTKDNAGDKKQPAVL